MKLALILILSLILVTLGIWAGKYRKEKNLSDMFFEALKDKSYRFIIVAMAAVFSIEGLLLLTMNKG